MPSESQNHLELKRLAYGWCVENGYRVHAYEVSIPMLQVRVDYAAARISRGKRAGEIAFLECKQSVADFRNHSRIESLLRAKLAKLAGRRALYEEWLQARIPNLRNGETLFPEYDSWDFSGADWEPYGKLLKEIERLAVRLECNTKFDRMTRARYANLHYVVATPESAIPAEIPPAWGLLVKAADALELVRRPIFCEISPTKRTMVLERIAAAASRSIVPPRWPEDDDYSI